MADTSSRVSTNMLGLSAVYRQRFCRHSAAAQGTARRLFAASTLNRLSSFFGIILLDEDRTGHSFRMARVTDSPRLHQYCVSDIKILQVFHLGIKGEAGTIGSCP